MQQYAGLQPGTYIGPFRIVAKIAEGGMGEIYEGHDDELHRRVAIKVLLPAALREADGLSRFKGEARALSQMDHQNIVRVIVGGEQDGIHFMVLEFIDGLPLDVYLTRHSPSLTEVLDIFTQMVRGFMAAHELEIIHRDIKPQNIMITTKGKVKIVDFGVAKAQTDHDQFKTTVGVVVGTRGFLAPEILKGAPATRQGDIYSLGLILKFMLTGEMPAAPVSDGVNRMPTTKFNLIIPNGLTQVLAGMTHATPNMRYTDLKDVIKELNQVNLRGLHADLLVQIPGKAPVANLEQLLATCREKGLDVVDARIAINLAAKPAGAPKPVDNGKTQVLNLKAATEFQVTDEALNRAIARVRQAKGAVIAGGLRSPGGGATPIPPSANAGAPISHSPMFTNTQNSNQSAGFPYVKLGLAVIAIAVVLKFFVFGSGGNEKNPFLRSVSSKFESILGRAPASPGN